MKGFLLEVFWCPHSCIPTLLFSFYILCYQHIVKALILIKIWSFHSILAFWRIRGWVWGYILFLSFQKTRQLHFTRPHSYEKMSKMVVLPWIHFSNQVGYMLQKFYMIWNWRIYRKKLQCDMNIDKKA